jgi:hypothetical protein
MHVALVVPDRELWSGEATTVIAKTTEGDIGVLTGHAPVFGVLAEGSLVEILTRCRSWRPRPSSAARSTPTGPSGSLTPRSPTPNRVLKSQPKPSTRGRSCGPRAGPDLSGRGAGA